MPIEPPAGYLTRPDAAKVYNRSCRALERGLDTALRTNDLDVLSHFKLMTKDGVVRDAKEVTIDGVKGLVAIGKTPVWYVEEAWLLSEYGRRGEPRPQKQPESPFVDDMLDDEHDAQIDEPTSPSNGTNTAVVSLYRRQLKKQDDEIKYLRRELEIKNEQIRDANERTRESNILMKDLQKMLGNWQDRAFQSLPGGGESRPETKPVERSEPNETVEVQPPKRTSSSSRPTKPKKKATGRRKKPKKQPDPKWYEFPTAKRLFHRS